MNHNPLNLSVGQLVLADGEHEVVISHFSPLGLFACVYEVGNPNGWNWTLLTSRLSIIL